MTKRKREEIKNKFNGKCAYCGKPLSDRFHVDHFKPIFRNDTIKPERAGDNSEENLFPSCIRCNLWKSTLTLEDFRNAISHQVFQLNRDSSNYRMAKDYGLIAEIPIRVKFYFERLEEIKRHDKELKDEIANLTES